VALEKVAEPTELHLPAGPRSFELVVPLGLRAESRVHEPEEGRAALGLEYVLGRDLREVLRLEVLAGSRPGAGWG